MSCVFWKSSGQWTIRRIGKHGKDGLSHPYRDAEGKSDSEGRMLKRQTGTANRAGIAVILERAVMGSGAVPFVLAAIKCLHLGKEVEALHGRA